MHGLSGPLPPRRRLSKCFEEWVLFPNNITEGGIALGREYNVAEKIACPYCGKTAEASQKSCPHCGGSFSKKAPPPGNKPVSPSQGHCPKCSALVEKGDIVCIQCGVNLITGKKVVSAKESPAAPAKESGANGPLIFGILAAVILVVGAIFFFLLQNPVESARNTALQGDYRTAIDALEQYGGEHPDDKDAAFLLAKIYWQDQQFDKASGALIALADVFPEAGAMAVLSSYQKDPENKQAVLEALRKLDGENNSEDWFAPLYGLAQAASSEVSQETSNAEVWSGAALQASALALEGNAGAARELLEAQSGSSDGEIMAVLGLILSELDEEESARVHLEKAVQEESSLSHLAQLRLGVYHFKNGQFSEARVIFEEVKRLHPDVEEAAFLLALSLEEEARNVPAIEAHERIMDKRGRYAGKSALQLAELYLRIDDSSNANDKILAARRLEKNSAKVETVLGRVRMLEGEMDAARKAFAAAVQMDRSYAPAHLEMGLMYLSQGAVAQGLRELETYLRLREATPADSSFHEIELLVEQLRQMSAS
jgi:tetratricopeptide (TPR) repeat protein